jgi:hypothetical protein
MKKMSLIMLLSLAGVFTQAATVNPQVRACRVANGQFFRVDTGLDQIGLCRIGRSVIGAIDLLNKDADIEDMPMSILDFQNGVTTCDSSHIVIFPNPAGRTLKACYYDDGSIIDLMTLNLGRNSQLNEQLNRVLNLN